MKRILIALCLVCACRTAMAQFGASPLLPGVLPSSELSDRRVQTDQRRHAQTSQSSPAQFVGSARQPFSHLLPSQSGEGKYSVDDDRYPDQEKTVVYNVTRTLPNGSSVTETRRMSFNLNIDFGSLPPEENKQDRHHCTRIRAVTNARHGYLIKALADEKDAENRAKILAKLKENYELNYRAESDWRRTKITELQERLTDLEAKLEERTSNEKDYVEASLKLAELHAKGLGVAPPAPGTGVQSQRDVYANSEPIRSQ